VIARITYELPHSEGLLFETDWVTPTEGYDHHRALTTFQHANPSARVQSLEDITDHYRRRAS
jgi:hypothetical protein